LFGICFLVLGIFTFIGTTIVFHSLSAVFIVDPTLAVRYHPDLQRSGLVNMHIALRERNGNACLAEFVVNDLVEFVQHRYPVIDAVDKDPQFEIKAVVTKTEKYGLRLRVFEDQWIGSGGLEHQFLGQDGVRTVSDPDWNPYPDNVVRKGPVDQAAGNEFLVGYDEFLAIPIQDGCGPNSNAGDGSADISNGDGITDSKRTLKKDDQAADEIGNDLLQSKAYADAQSGNQPLDTRPFDADGRKYNHNPDGCYHVVEDGGNRVA
jgi:hypothetical protein